MNDFSYWDPNGTPGNSDDDFWVDGDYHLHHNSLCINAGDPCFVPDPWEVDMDCEPRIRLPSRLQLTRGLLAYINSPRITSEENTHR